MLVNKIFGSTKEESTLIDEELTITENGTYTAPRGIRYTPIKVQVKSSNEEQETLTIELPSDFGQSQYIYHFRVNANKVLFSGNKSGLGIWLYDKSLGTTRKIYADASTSKWNTFFINETKNRCVISSTSSDDLGILVYNVEDDTLVKKYTSGYNWIYFGSVKDDILISSSNSSTSNSGILVYDASANTITKKYSNDYGWQYFVTIGNECIITSTGNTTAKKYAKVYNYTSKTIETIGSNFEFYNVRYSYIVNDLVLLSSSSINGIYYYRNGMSLPEQLYSGRNTYAYFYQINENKVLISSSTTSYNGLLLFDYETMTVTLLHSSGSGWLYPGLDNIVNNIDNDRYLISGASSSVGLLLFKNSTNTITALFNYGSWYNDLKKINDTEYIIKSTRADLEERILKYNSETDTAEMIGYQILEE